MSIYYPKINSLFKRDIKTFKVIPSIREDDTILALTYINNLIIEEKIDGTNAHIEYTNNIWGEFIDYYSRKNKIEDCPNCAKKLNRPYDVNGFPIEIFKCSICKGKGYKDIKFIRETLERVINLVRLKDWYKQNFKQDKDSASVTIKIYGEVFGDKINKGGKYVGKKDYRDFRVFDIVIGNSWLSPIKRNELCKELNLIPIPVITYLFRFPTFKECYDMLFRTKNKSLLAEEFGQEAILEGYIIRPQLSLYTNKGRVIGKIK